jgi:hypothetical protein
MITRIDQLPPRGLRNLLKMGFVALFLLLLGPGLALDHASANEVQKFSSRVAKSSTKDNGLVKFTAVVNTGAMPMDLATELQAGTCEMTVENATASFSGTWALENCAGDSKKLACARSAEKAALWMRLYKKNPAVHRIRFVVRGVPETATGAAPLSGDMIVTLSCNSTALWTDTLVNCTSSRGDQVRKCSGS